MVDSEQDGTDETHIRPVSSLRSQFEHLTDQKGLRPPNSNLGLKKNFSQHVYGHSDDETHSRSLTGSSLKPITPLQSRGRNVSPGRAAPFGEHEKSRPNDPQTAHQHSSLQQRSLSVGLSRSVPSQSSAIVKSPRSPTRPPLVSKRKPTYQLPAKAATPSPPPPQPQPRPFNSFRSPSTANDVSSKAEAPQPQLGNERIVASSAAQTDSRTHFHHSLAQPNEPLGIDSSRLERRSLDTGHRAGTLRSSPLAVREQDFRPELPPRQVLENPPGQLLQVSSRPPLGRIRTDHRNEYPKIPSKARVPSAPQPSWINSAPTQTEHAVSPGGHHKSTRSVDHIDKTSILIQTPNHPANLDKTGTINANPAQRSDTEPTPNSGEYPDTSSSNRRPPFIRQGVRMVQPNYDTKLFEISNRYLCTSGYLTKAWDLMNGELIMTLSLGEKEIRVTALAFKPESKPENESVQIWLGTNYGDMYEVDITTQAILRTRLAAHNRREIIKIFRYQNNMWSLDEDGRLNIWHANDSEMPSLEKNPLVRRIPRGHSFSILIQDTLWLAIGTGIRIFRPNSVDETKFVVKDEPLSQPGVGEITSGAMIPGKAGFVYFGHADGKISSYSTRDFSCLGIFNVSNYKINCLAGAGSYLWAGYSSGMICVYDTSTTPWKTKKDWQAHDRPVTSISVDLCNIWKPAQIQVASISTDNTVRLWDGMLEQDWLENRMHDRESDYCTFRKISATIVTWNAGASTPASLRYDEEKNRIFTEMLHVDSPSDLLVFGFQELVDLEDKKLTAKNIFKGSKKKDSSEQDHMSRQYRAWRDYLVRSIEDSMPANEPYQLLHTASLVGLFSCIFVKASQRDYIDHVHAAELKRGLGGLHGNKGALILRFIFQDSSVCLMNCHLAAGQSQTAHRNNDVSAVLELAMLPMEADPTIRCNRFVGGGDGSMVLDHEICILNGDLNYRIETMGRDTVIKAIHAQQYHRLLERDQLLVSRRRNPGFRLRDFQESPISFAPTYKYDLGTDHYDTSEKHRTPAWCDRILYRGPGKVEQILYRRHELQISDHRPVSGIFVMNIKRIIPSKRQKAWEECEARFEAFRRKTIEEMRLSP